MLLKIIKIKNGYALENYRIYECDICKDEIEEAWPKVFGTVENTHYCGKCAFKQGIISAEKYIKDFLYFLPDGIRVAIDPETGEIATTMYKFDWEKTDRQNRRSVEYSNWRTQVFERDDYTCQICKQRGGPLEAHHIKSFKHYKRDRYKVSNGITFCEQCHKRVHKENDSRWIYAKKQQ